MDLNAEFADPVNRDFRLQSTSRFRRATPDGIDKGPFPFRADIFYVKPDGDDGADGLSIDTAWRSLEKATKDLKPGDTVYLQTGVYVGDLNLKTSAETDHPISIRGRGADPATIAGSATIADSSNLTFERLNFQKPVNVTNSANVDLKNCRFLGENVGLTATETTNLTISHCEFRGFSNVGLMLRNCSKTDLRGTIFDNENGGAVSVDEIDSVAFSDYNAYRNPSMAWSVNGEATALESLDHDKHSTDMKNPVALKGSGPHGRPVGPCRFEKLLKTLRLEKKPTVYSVSSTTANLEWRTSLPATCVVAWGETPECENERIYECDGFATFSLTGLKSETTYYLKIKSLRIPREMAEDVKADPVEIQMEPVPFTTLKTDPVPRTLHVAIDGDDANSGLDPANAWRTIQRAADDVRPGDTVLVGGGTYAETVRLRVTGAADAPITFANASGEKVMFSGAGKRLNRGFIADDKSHLRFDGFYFKDFNREPLHVSNWHVRYAANFLFLNGSDIRVSRCFADGRGGYSARFIIAWRVRGISIDNCVVMDKMSGSMMFRNCPDVRMDHMVVCRPKITCFYMLNEAKEPAEMNNSILTDMLRKKAKHNIGMIYGRTFPMKNNCYFIREFPPGERHIMGESTATDLKELIKDPVFANPKFAGDPTPDAEGFAADRMVNPHINIDFNSFFATNPEVIERGIGLQPEAFKEFKFPEGSEPQTKAKD